MKRYKNIIFDFDGVICDSVDIKTAAFLELYKNYDVSIQKEVQSYHIKYGGISRYKKIRYFENNILNNNSSDYKLKKLSNKFSKLVVDKVIKSKYIVGVIQFIKLYSSTHKIFICTGTPELEMIKILKKKKIIDLFDKVYGSPSTKTEIINKIFKENKIKNHECVFFGDTMTDYVAAKESCIDFIGIKNNKTKFPKNTFLIDNFLDSKIN